MPMELKIWAAALTHTYNTKDMQAQGFILVLCPYNMHLKFDVLIKHLQESYFTFALFYGITRTLNLSKYLLAIKS